MEKKDFSGASGPQFGVQSMRGKKETTTNFSQTKKGNQTKGFCNNMITFGLVISQHYKYFNVNNYVNLFTNNCK